MKVKIHALVLFIKTSAFTIFLALLFQIAPLKAQERASLFTIEQVRSYPFPNQLVASSKGSRIAWVFNDRGARNIWVAEGPGFLPRRLTNYTMDDGQELSAVAISANGDYVVYIRGGDSDASFPGPPVNPNSNAVRPEVKIWSTPFNGGEPKTLGEGAAPSFSSAGDLVAFERGGGIWVAPANGSSPAKQIVSIKGYSSSPVWSPDGQRLAFVSDRGDHSFIAVYTSSSAPIVYLAPSTERDSAPDWAPDGKRITFVRQPGAGGSPEPVMTPHPATWEIWAADAKSGLGQPLWKSPATLRGSFPNTHGGPNLHWAASGRIVFLSFADGWPHLYSLDEKGGNATLLTPGNYMSEFIRLSPDGRYVVFSANAGQTEGDIDRRHVMRVPVDKAAPELLTPGEGLEWAPVVTGDGLTIAFISATTKRPPLPAVIPALGGKVRLLAEDRIPTTFPSQHLVTPKQVVFKASDGTPVHAQLFERDTDGATKRPAVVFVHGGPRRQMLLGWNYSGYYSNFYALNQYFASQGYVALAINYRLGIGYGYEFQNPIEGGARGASEYRDIQAAGEYLRALPQVDSRRIGIYGGSYGGYLTALALARNSDIFAAGVDLNGVHDFTAERARGLINKDTFENAPDAQRAFEVAWKSSPASSIDTWKSPVLLIHGDDDRNVRFNQTVDLAQRLKKAGVPFEELILPDETHDFMRYDSWLRVNTATAAFFEKTLRRAK